MNLLRLTSLFSALLFSANAFSINWSEESVVSYLRTYDGVTYSIGLKDDSCSNEKDYFFVYDRADNKAFSAIALTSLSAGKKVRISYDTSIDSIHCYVDGIWIVH